MYYRHRVPTEIISYAVWLDFTLPLSYRDVQKLLLYRGIEVSHEAIRAWCQKFGQQFANKIRCRRPQPGAKWYLDEMVILINGEHFYLWRAVDEDANVLDILMQRRPDKAAAKKFFRKLLKKQGFVPRVIVTDKLKSYGAAKRDLLSSVEHRQHKGLNNPAENSHQPTRVRERRMRRFKSPGHAQRFCSSFELIRQHFHPKQHRLSATEYRQVMHQRFLCWRELTGIKIAA
jgi:putative transposase